MKIFLIGMPGSGKTTIGKELAVHLSIPFVDLDAEIERAEGTAIQEIFRQHGEEYFRITESRLLRDWAARPMSFVMATGGGAPCFHQGIEVINRQGVSIFLDCAVSELIDRVKKNRDRPLLLSADEQELRKKLEDMRAARLSCYQRAHITSVDSSLESLLKQIELRK